MELDYVLVPAGLGVLLAYHGWLVYAIRYKPRRTVIGLNSESRHQWIHSLMIDPVKSGIMGVQALRNNLMACTQLATISITLSSLITALVSSSLSSSSTGTSLETVEILSTTFSYTSITLDHITSKYFSILLCFLFAFFCNLQAMRYYTHVSFLVTSPWSQGKTRHIEYISRHLNNGSFFWSLGVRAYYFSFPLLLWIFGCIPMFVCCIAMTFVLYFLDTTNHFTNEYKELSNEDDASSECDTESVDGSMVTVRSRNSSIGFPVMADADRR